VEVPPHTRVLDAAERLFYARGIQAVGMDEVRTAADVSLRRLYQLFASKELLIEGFLERRDVRWRSRLADHVARSPSPQARLLAVFDWLEQWFREPDFRGCAWINAYGELGATSSAVREQTRRHKDAFRAYLGELVAAAGLPAAGTEQLYLLAEGAMVTAAIFGTPEPAMTARTAATSLIAAYGSRPVDKRPSRQREALTVRRASVL
jgi:AcrR family transcriptional regulator